MKSAIKKPWFGPAKTYRGLRISSWQGAIASLTFFVVLFTDIAYVNTLLIKIIIALFAVIAFCFVVFKTGDLSNSIVF